jgi:2-C-methyl-D-erythritol 4-phosphate cytidylyltransferase
MSETVLSNPKIVAIIPAAGSGSRMGEALPKQYLAINGVPMIFHTLAAFAQIERIQQIVVVISHDDPHWDLLFEKFGVDIAAKVNIQRVGGATRALSVLNGLHEFSDRYTHDDWALVHDAARPCISPLLIAQFLDALTDEKIGGLLALPVADTIKLGNSDEKVERTVSRNNLWRAQTPQMFRYHLLIEALARMPNATDESEAIEALGHKPKLVMGDSANLKVTYATDLKIAAVLLGGRER